MFILYTVYVFLNLASLFSLFMSLYIEWPSEISFSLYFGVKTRYIDFKDTTCLWNSDEANVSFNRFYSVKCGKLDEINIFKMTKAFFLFLFFLSVDFFFFYFFFVKFTFKHMSYFISRIKNGYI